jgi:high-affinity iron transporter
VLAEFLIAFRESLEAALVVGIILAYLEKTKNTGYNRHVYLGLASGLLCSIIAAAMIQSVLGEFAGAAEQLFEGTLMLLAALLMGWMIIWMMNQGSMRAKIESEVGGRIGAGKALGIVAFTFVSVFREGVETAIFIFAAVAQNPENAVAGIIAGFSAAVLLAFLIFETAVKVDIKRFFTLTSVVLTVFAAGIFASGVHEFQEAGWLPEGRPIWSTKAVLDQEGDAGSIVRALTGYADSPTLPEAVAYVGYYGAFFAAYAALRRG